MHELYATQAILEKAIQKANEAKAKRITHLYLVVGEISTYTDDSVQFYWDDLSKGTLAEGAVLHYPSCANRSAVHELFYEISSKGRRNHLPRLRRGWRKDHCGGRILYGSAGCRIKSRVVFVFKIISLTLICKSGIFVGLRCGVEQWQLVGLITRRSQVRVLPPLPDIKKTADAVFFVLLGMFLSWRGLRRIRMIN